MLPPQSSLLGRSSRVRISCRALKTREHICQSCERYGRHHCCRSSSQEADRGGARKVREQFTTGLRVCSYHLTAISGTIKFTAQTKMGLNSELSGFARERGHKTQAINHAVATPLIPPDPVFCVSYTQCAHLLFHDQI